MHPWSHPEPLPWASYSVLLQVLKARAIPRVDNVARDSSCPSKFTDVRARMLRERDLPRRRAQCQQGKLDWAAVSPRHPKGRMLLRAQARRAVTIGPGLARAEQRIFIVTADP